MKVKAAIALEKAKPLIVDYRLITTIKM